MSTLSKRDAMKLVYDIRSANVAGHAIAARAGGGDHAALAGFLGGLESVLRYHFTRHGCFEAATALSAAMNHMPTNAEIAARNAQIDRLSRKPVGSAS